MKNVSLKVTDDQLVITVDIKKTFGPSKSGKSTIVATTEGIVSVEGTPDIRLGLNVFK